MEWLVGFLAIVGIILLVSIVLIGIGFLAFTETGNEILCFLFFIAIVIALIYFFTVKAYQFGEFLLHGQ